MATPVYLEVGAKKVFACAVDWPGWCRAGKTEDEALEALALYVPRYAVVTKKAGVTFPKTVGDDLDVVEKVKGNATTDFGAPGIVPKLASASLTKAQAERRAALVEASWNVLADVVKHAPASLRKGPRGGGRDRDAIVTHVIGAEVAYARKAGVRIREPDRDDRVAVEAARAEILAAIVASSDAAWPARYLARRTAWHAVDHAWEIEDRSEPS